jgi:hypothetical protein
MLPRLHLLPILAMDMEMAEDDFHLTRPMWSTFPQWIVDENLFPALVGADPGYDSFHHALSIA